MRSLIEMLPSEIKARKAEIEVMAKELLEKYKVGYKFGWMSKYKAYGTCHHGKSTIFLTTRGIDRPDEDIKRTILHEIAHYFIYTAYLEECEMVGGRYGDSRVYKPASHGKEFEAKFKELRELEGISDNHSDYVMRKIPTHYVIYKGKAHYSYRRAPSKATRNHVESFSHIDGIPESKGKLKIITHAKYVKDILRKNG